VRAGAVAPLAHDEVLRVDDVSKKFTGTLRLSLAHGLVDLGNNLIGRPSPTDRLRKGEYWAVDEVSFSVRRGESVGLIGANGAGKTTLLRVIAGIYPPDRGTVQVRGRLTALLATGTGFHPYMSGRENVYLNGSLLGMDQEQIDARMDAIIDFAELGTFIDRPVSTYSSGMRGRLGFAVSTALEPDVLILDEVLATGDLAFRQRCFRRLDDIAGRTSFILVTHLVTHIQRVCETVVWLDEGAVREIGPTEEVLPRYSAWMAGLDATYQRRQGRDPGEMTID